MTDNQQSSNPNGREPESMSHADRHAVADALVVEMSELFHGYLDSTVPFEELSFEIFDTLQTLFAIAHGDTSIDYFDTDGLLEDIPRHCPDPDPPGTGSSD